MGRVRKGPFHFLVLGSLRPDKKENQTTPAPALQTKFMTLKAESVLAGVSHC